MRVGSDDNSSSNTQSSVSTLKGRLSLIKSDDTFIKVEGPFEKMISGFVGSLN